MCETINYSHLTHQLLLVGEMVTKQNFDHSWSSKPAIPLEVLSPQFACKKEFVSF